MSETLYEDSTTRFWIGRAKSPHNGEILYEITSRGMSIALNESQALRFCLVLMSEWSEELHRCRTTLRKQEKTR